MTEFEKRTIATLAAMERIRYEQANPDAFTSPDTHLKCVLSAYNMALGTSDDEEILFEELLSMMNQAWGALR